MSNFQDSLSRAVKVHLARAGKTQEWLASKIGMSPSGLSHRLTGRVLLDTADMSMIAEAFELDVFDLVRLAQAETLAA